MAKPLSPLTAAQSAGLTCLPKFYGCQEVVDLVFSGDQEAFIQAWIAGVIPPQVWKACEDTPGQIQIDRLLLRRIAQLLGHLQDPTGGR